MTDHTYPTDDGADLRDALQRAADSVCPRCQDGSGRICTECVDEINAMGPESLENPMELKR